MKEVCREVLQRTYLFLDGELLSVSERLEIQGHLEACGPCLERVGLEKEFHSLLTRIKDHDVCPQKLRHKILALLEQG